MAYENLLQYGQGNSNFSPAQVPGFDMGTSAYSPVAVASPITGAPPAPGADMTQALASFGPQVGAAGMEPTTMQTLFGGKLADGSSQMGLVPAGLGTANALLSGWLGMQQYGLAKKQINASIESGKRNFNAQAKTINSQLEDRQRYRNQMQPGANQDTASYMAKYGVREYE